MTTPATGADGASPDESELGPEKFASQVGGRSEVESALKARELNSQKGVDAEAARQEKNKDISLAAQEGSLTKEALRELEKAEERRKIEEEAAELLRYSQVAVSEATRTLATRLEEDIVVAVLGKQESAEKVGIMASLSPESIVQGVFGDVPVAFEVSNQTEVVSAALPRLARGLSLWQERLLIQMNDLGDYFF